MKLSLTTQQPRGYFFCKLPEPKASHLTSILYSSLGFQSPGEIGLAYMLESGTYEELEKHPYTSPPELPDVLKPGQESSQAEGTTA